MIKDLMLVDKELADNPTTRVPVCMVLDCSPSMSGETRYGAPIEQMNPRPIDALNEGIRHFFTTVKEDDRARWAVEIAIVAFSGTAEMVLDFASIDRQTIPTLEVEMRNGGTSIGTAVRLGLELVDNRKKKYKKAGTTYFQPWLVLMTDGYPTDKTHFEIAEEVSRRVMDKKLTVFPIGIGKAADLNVLKMFSPKRDPLRLKGLRFQEFFEFLSNSVVAVSHSTPQDPAELDYASGPQAKGWGVTY